MINQAVLMGRITADMDLRQAQSGSSIVSFTLAIDRDFVKQGEERKTDFISCVAYGKTAEFIAKFFGKGKMLAVSGQLRSRHYDDRNGITHYVTELVCEKASFTGERSDSGSAEKYSEPAGKKQTAYQTNADVLGDFEDVLSDEGVPF